MEEVIVTMREDPQLTGLSIQTCHSWSERRLKEAET